MNEITFSIFQQSPAATAKIAELLKQFEAEERIRVQLEVISWITGWQKLVEMGLYHTGADISEIGSTWIMDLVRMDVLRPFSEVEVKAITDGRPYFPAAWKGGSSEGPHGHTVWAIPLTGDTRAIYYRRDWLNKSGVDEKTAFKDLSSFDETLSAILKTGYPIPLSLPTGHSRNEIHWLASWVWDSGGDFLSADGTNIEFNSPEAIKGFKAYFSLGRFLGTQRTAEISEADFAFQEGQSAVTISGPWILHEQKAEEVANNLGIAPVPGIPFVGGAHLAVWNHSHHPEEALRLIRFLSRPEIHNSLYPLLGLPVTDDGWTNPIFKETGYEVFQQAMQTGRCFPNSQLWGLVEKRLSDLLPVLWAETLAHPEQLDSIVENNLNGLARRLQMTIRG